MIETKAAFARRIGINKSNVTRAAQDGRIVLTKDGRVEVEASIQRWYETKGGRDDVAARHAAQRGADIPMPPPSNDNATAGGFGATADATAGTTDGHSDAAGRTRYKTEVLHYENQSIRLEMALRRGLRYPLILVKREALGLGATVRAAMERIIDQTAPRLAVMADDLDRRRLIDVELRRLRWMVKLEMPRALRRMRATGAKVVRSGPTRDGASGDAE